MFVTDSGYTSHIANSLKNMTNLRESKTVVDRGNKKMMTGLLRGEWKGYQERYGRFYPVTCTDTVYIPDLSVNIFSVTCALTKGFKAIS